MKKTSILHLVTLALFWAFSSVSFAANPFITFQKQAETLPLFEPGTIPVIYCAPDVDPGILRAVNDLKLDFQRVTGVAPQEIGRAHV